MSARRVGEAQESAESGAGLAHPGEDRRAFVRWSVCAAAAILAHGLAGAAMLRWQTEADAVAPTATIVIELSPLVTAPKVLELETPPTPEQVQAESSTEKVVEKDFEEERQAVEEAFVPKLEMVEPRLEPRPETEPLQPREARQEVDIQHVEAPSQTPPIVVVEGKSETELAPPKQNDAKQIDAPLSILAGDKPHERTAQPKGDKPAPNKPQQKQAPDRTASKPQFAQARQAATSQAPAASTPSNSNALPNWRSQIVSILERNKRYPAEAQARQEHGVSRLAFTLNRQGHVTSAHIAGSSGSAALDAETLALVRRVQPFPPPPPEVAGTQISLVVAMRYY
jgi:periplasmic protein TonB